MEKKHQWNLIEYFNICLTKNGFENNFLKTEGILLGLSALMMTS